MKKFLVFILLLALAGGGIYFYLIRNGHNMESILNTPDKIGLSVNCSAVESLILTSTVEITVNNSTSRNHKNVTVHVTAYDKKGNIIKQKDTVFARSLGPNASLSKTITLPAKTVECDCVILDSDPE
ncbi:MAG: hypothetical protein GQ574_26335 [Crocinitomix sp.]|nr:hypothetical protein [Crocinitomix sp.]